MPATLPRSVIIERSQEGYADVHRHEPEGHLDSVLGFVQFALLKGDEPGDYISHTVWQSREAFMTWAQSDAFRQAHSARPTEGLVIGHPRAAFYESVLVEGASSVARV
ncbi:antibiotic biosynthesis monooxygenase [bacterium]|nr:antibiotic biosynthesis monooxygenase [bacterium]